MKKVFFLLLLPVCLRAQLPFAETLPSGTSGQTLRHNGTSYVSSSVITNNGTNVGIGASPDGTYKLYTSGAAKFAGRIYATGTGAYSVSTSPNLLLENTTSSTGRPFYLLSSDLGKLEFYSTPNSTPIMSLSNIGDVTVSKRALLTEKWGASGSGNELLGRNSSGGLCKITLGSGLTLTDSTLSASGGGTPGGSTTQMQYNNAGAFDGQSNITTTEGATTGNELSIAGGSVTTGKALNVTANALTTGSVASISSTSTSAGSNTQTGLNVALSGANGTSGQTTYGAQISNTHTGTNSTNVGLKVTASGGTNNYAALFTGYVGFGVSAPTCPLHFTGTNVAYRGQISLEGSPTDFSHMTFYEGATTNTNLVGNIYTDNSVNAMVLSAYKSDGYIRFETNAYGERMRIAADGKVGIGTTSSTSTLMVDGANGYTQFRLADSYTPTGSADTNGATGQVAWDDNYLYVKTAAGWKRAALATF